MLAFKFIIANRLNVNATVVDTPDLTTFKALFKAIADGVCNNEGEILIKIANWHEDTGSADHSFLREYAKTI